MDGGRARSSRRFSLRNITVIERSKLQQTVGGTAVGNFMEWYDFGIYGFMATTLAAVFFPSGSGLALVATFAAFAVSFLVRPIGGFFFGPLADRIGRKRVLTITITMMAAGTVAIGLLPGYQTLGVWAFVLLFAARIVQGFSTGGEYVDAMVFMTEHSPDRRRGFWVSWLPVGTLTGYIVGAGLVTALTTFLSQDALLAWGWRIPFLSAAVIGLVGLYIRLKLEESPAYQQQEQTPEHKGMRQFRRTVVDQWRPLLVVVGLVMGINVVTYMLTAYLPTYLKATVGVSDTRALLIILIVLVILVLAVTQVARLSDRIGRKPIMFLGCGVVLAGAIPTFLLLRTGGNLMIFAGALLLGLMLLCFNTTEPATLPALFPTEVRGGAVSIGYNFSVSAFGGTTPLIAQALVTATGSTLVPAYYLMLAGAVGVVAVMFTPETAREPLPGTPPTAASEAEAREMATDQPPPSQH